MRDKLLELCSRGSAGSLAFLLKGVELDWFQTFSVAYALITKSCLLSLDTGLGKTLVASAVMQWYRKAYPEVKFLYICERGNYEQTLSKIEGLTSLKVIGTTAEQSSVVTTFLGKGVENYDVLVLTYEAVRDFNLNLELLKYRRLFTGVIVDESHKLGNDISNTTKVLRGILSQATFKLFMTATPLSVSVRQAISQFNILYPEFFKTVDYESYCRQFEVRDDETNKVISYKNLNVLQEDFSLHYLSFTRKELGLKGDYQVHLITCQPYLSYAKTLNRNKKHLLKLKNGSNALEQLSRVLTSCKETGKRGLIYANINEVKQDIADELQQQGFNFGIIDGSLSSSKDRQQTIKDFREGKLDVVITNIITGLDLDCDFILFYELTVNVKQMIGRAERGLKGNNIELYFFIVEDSCEVDYYLENVYNKSLLLKELFQKDNDELEKVKKLLRG